MTGDHLTIEGYQTLKRQLDAVSADLELICNAFMEGQPPGSCFTPGQIADWVRDKRHYEMQQADRRDRAANK